MKQWTLTKHREAAYQMHNLYYNARKEGTECPTCGNLRERKYSVEEIATQYECSVGEAKSMIKWAKDNPPYAPKAVKKKPRKYRVKHAGL